MRECLCVVCFVRTHRMPPIHSLSSSVFHSPALWHRTYSERITHHTASIVRRRCRSLAVVFVVVDYYYYSLVHSMNVLRVSGIRTCIMDTAIGDETLFIEYPHVFAPHCKMWRSHCAALHTATFRHRLAMHMLHTLLFDHHYYSHYDGTDKSVSTKFSHRQGIWTSASAKHPTVKTSSSS